MYGLMSSLNFSSYIIVTLCLTHITIIAVTLYLHRSQAHRAVVFNNKVNHFFRLWLWLTTGMVTKEWVAIHRKHHVHTEKSEDPHSPKVHGIKKVLFQGAELYRSASKDTKMLKRYGEGTPNDWIEKNLYSKHEKLGILIMLAFNLTMFGLPGIIIWSVQMLWIPFWAAGVINGLGHHFGYRNHLCKDYSSNLFPIGIVIGGEELHNNHHAHGRSSKFSTKWWEFDIGWMYIKLLSYCKLAIVQNHMPELEHNPNKKYIDYATIHALFTKKFQILTNYTKDVIHPIVSSYNKKEYGIDTNKLKSWLLVDSKWISKKSQEQIEYMQDKYDSIKTVCDFREQLQSIWGNNSLSREEILEMFSSWCNRAESSGIDELKDFVNKIKSISLR